MHFLRQIRTGVLCSLLLLLGACNDFKKEGDGLSLSVPATLAMGDKDPQTISFTVGYGGTDGSGVSVSATSSDTLAIPASGFSFGGSGNARTLTITPSRISGSSATVQVVVTATGGSETKSSAITVTLSHTNRPPTFVSTGGLSGPTVYSGSTTGDISFVVGDEDTSVSSLTLSGSSANTSVIPDSGIAFGGMTSERTIRITPTAGFYLTSSVVVPVTITLSDGTDSTTYLVNVSVVPMPASKLAFKVQPPASISWSSAAPSSSSSFSFTVELQSSTGVPVTNTNATVKIEAASDATCTTILTGATPNGPFGTSATTTNWYSGSIAASTATGVVTFTGVKLRAEGTYYLKASSGSYTSACSQLVTVSATASSPANWLWKSGAKISGVNPNYTTSPVYPGARGYSASWRDGGVLWLFGGTGYASTGTAVGQLNDLWSYDTATGTWSYHTGGATYLNQNGSCSSGTRWPGAREGAATWTDASGDFYLFGGYGMDCSTGAPGYLNDLWKYTRNTLSWSKISGSDTRNANGTTTTYPSAREFASVVRVSGTEVYLFGGEGCDVTTAGCSYTDPSKHGYLNDLWKFDGTNWTRLTGNDAFNQSSVYSGTVKVGSRSGAALIADTVASPLNLYLFGGRAAGGESSELWKYDVSGGTWSVVQQQVGFNQPSVSGSLGTSSSTYHPGGRDATVYWYDSANRMFWVFGGYGYGTGATGEKLNDLWKYDLAHGTWAWVGGSPTVQARGIYPSSVGTADSSAIAGARGVGAYWFDSSFLWIFGGHGVDANGTEGYLSDLWRLTPP